MKSSLCSINAGDSFSHTISPYPIVGDHPEGECRRLGDRPSNSCSIVLADFMVLIMFDQTY